MKKLFTASIVCFILLISCIPVFADTAIEAVGDTEESYEVIVPATLAPGEVGKITLTGAFPSNKKIIVSADSRVKLTNVSTNATIWLDVYFNGIEEVGSDYSYINVSEKIEIEEPDVLFGIWTGNIEYDVQVEILDTEDVKPAIEEEISDDKGLEDNNIEENDNLSDDVIESENNNEIVENNDVSDKTGEENVDTEIMDEKNVEEDIDNLENLEEENEFQKDNVNENGNETNESPDTKITEDSQEILETDIQDDVEINDTSSINELIEENMVNKESIQE